MLVANCCQLLMGTRYESYLSDSFLIRVQVLIQFTPQVLPPSPEKACSERPELGDTDEKANRTRTDLALKVS